ncbi:Glycosyltransferase SypN [Fimbriiglobus ruber]|uniref:Glycosyltransferase SypN n=2 Tax=Fimbriiglobus ruber TaxID=1908690 RepID=A0A225EGJ7_9BACT|nr:Glycosyltransferase SypN [Fimbriiglobus ruber]
MIDPAHPSRPLLVFADDWGRHPSSCQHLIGKLLPHREVVWVNTIGTRPPRLDWSTARRVAGKFRQWFGPRPAVPTTAPEQAPALSPRIISPKMWPSFRSAFGRGLNRKLLTRALKSLVESLAQPPDVVTTLPLVADLIGVLPVRRWVYYCVDDFSVWPGYDGATMLTMERDLIPKVDAVVAVSDTLVKHVDELGKPAHLLTHGVDLDHWRSPVSPGLPLEFAGLKPPVILFWGVVDRRMDMAFVKHLSAHLPEGTIVLVGPKEDPDPELLALPRVVYLPPVAFDRLPALAAAAAVLVMPYIDAPVTHAMQPLKLKEYIATGRPAVVRALPATKEWGDCVDLAATPEEFTARVINRLTTGLPGDQNQARVRLNREGWADKAHQLEKWVNGE